MKTTITIPLQQQIAEHQRTIATIQARVVILETCGMRKSVSYWRGVIAACEFCIRACGNRLAELDA